MFQFTQGMSHSCNEMLAFYIENTCGRTSLMGGTSACGEEKLPFCTKSSEKSISLGNLTVVSLQTKEKKTLWGTQELSRTVSFSCFEFNPQILLAVALGHCALAFTCPSKYSIYPVLKNILSMSIYFLIFYLFFCSFVFLFFFNISPDLCPKLAKNDFKREKNV